MNLSGAAPDLGWQIGSWTGTTNNASTAATNTVTMPAANHAAGVNYTQNCFTLSLSHTGSGTDPVVTPTNSTGCPANTYLSGATVQLSATADAGWQVGSWTGTTNNSSTLATNTVTMPGTNHAASVNFITTPVTSGWVAYNDCVYDPATNYTVPNVTYYDIGTGHTHGSSGLLKNLATGADTPVTATLTQSGTVVWESGTASGGKDTAVTPMPTTPFTASPT